MTVHRIKTCSCGHSEDWHEGSVGRCTYGHGHVMGGCTCERFGRRRHAAAAVAAASAEPAVLPAPYIPEPPLKAVAEAATAMRMHADALIRALAEAEHDGVRVLDKPAVARLKATALNGKASHRPAKRAPSRGSGERKILTVLAQHPDGLSKVQVALMTGYSHTSGGFRNYLSAMRTAGFLNGSGDRMTITDTGRRELGAFEPLPCGLALLEYWKTNAGGKCERLILDELAAVHPRALTKEAVASRTGYQPTSGGFRNALSRLRTLQLIKGRGEVGLSAALAGAIAEGSLQ